MTFDNIRNNLKDLERVFDVLKNKLKKGQSCKPIEINLNLEKEAELLCEIENLKNKLETYENKVGSTKSNDNTKEEIALSIPIAAHKKEVEELKKAHLQDLEKVKRQCEDVLNEHKAQIQELQANIKRFKGELNLLKGSIRVFCRIKPLQNGISAGLIYSDNVIRTNKDKAEHVFEFDRVFDGLTSQLEVFNEVEDSIESVFDGYKTCLFAYGQTGSGKTHTMIGTLDNPGILGRSLERINKLYNHYNNDGWTVEMSVNCIEIYNEEIRDLLGDAENKNKVTISHLKGITELKNCTEIRSLGNNLDELFRQGIAKRMVGATMSNLQSSRSHTVFTIKINLSNLNEHRKGVLCLIDLAGSERLDKSRSEGKRLKETQNINKSLSCLGDVFTAILNKEAYVPFRNSKLTYLLQEYLSGNSRVSMILNIAQELEHKPETICTLRFGHKVSECKLGRACRAVEKRQ